ncbi:DinB family protein [Paenibacillus sp. GCM10027628]|uniref:DinB family protein n=1 Tax=Paenibacillus sp. GCM10027628 TaxID=3273413 RepID=UPI003640C01B
MVYVTVQSFIEDYQNELTVTQKLLDALTDGSLKQEIAPGYRTLGDLAWHLIPSGGILEPTGLKVDYPPAEAPQSAAEIAQAYKKTTQSLIEAVRTQWNDETLQVTVNMFGQPWKNGFTLDMFIKHEIHHRGQLTILMRQAGLPVTGAYGPSKEEWSLMGMEAPTR